MKIVVAYIRPELLSTVKQALLARGLFSMSVQDALGAMAEDSSFASPEHAITDGERKCMRLELGVSESQLDVVFEALRDAVNSSRANDVTVFVQEAVRTIRIRTSEDVDYDRQEAVA